MKQVAFKEFPALPLIEQGSWGARDLGSHASTMVLYQHDRDNYMIEWDIPGLDVVEHIGLIFENSELTDYDGVMCLPKQAAQFLREQGFVVGEAML